MSASQLSIGRAMMAVGLVATDLAILRASDGVVKYPPIWILLGVLNFVGIWKLILARRIRAAHYRLLMISIVSFLAWGDAVASDYSHPLGALVRWYEHVAGAKVNIISRQSLRIGDFWLACFLSVALACVIENAVVLVERHMGRASAAFSRGAVAGFGIFAVMAFIRWAATGRWPPYYRQFSGHWSVTVMVVCLVCGGLIGLSRLKAK
jgi:hypothetical protein